MKGRHLLAATVTGSLSSLILLARHGEPFRSTGPLVVGEFPGEVRPSADPRTDERAYWVHNTGVRDVQIREVASGARDEVREASVGTRRARPATGSTWSRGDLLGAAAQPAQGALLPPGSERMLFVRVTGEGDPPSPLVALTYQYRGQVFTAHA